MVSQQEAFSMPMVRELACVWSGIKKQIFSKTTSAYEGQGQTLQWSASGIAVRLERLKAMFF
jgi:hypothetical protein